MAVEFYRKEEVSFDSEISPQYPDTYLGQQTFINVQGGNIIKKGLFEFKIADTPQFGEATLLRAKLGLYANSVTQGVSQPKITAFLMKRNLSENTNGEEEGSLVLTPNNMMTIGCRPTTGTFWEESFDTDKTLNNDSANTVENIAGTVTRNADYGVFVDDFIAFLR